MCGLPSQTQPWDPVNHPTDRDPRLTKALLDEGHLVQPQRHPHGIMDPLLSHVDAERQLQHLQDQGQRDSVREAAG